MSQRHPKPPAWASNTINFVLRDAAVRAREGTLRNVFLTHTPAGLALCAWSSSGQGSDVVILFRPLYEHLANVAVARANGDPPTLVASWQKLSEAIVIIEARPTGIIHYTAATREAARDLMRLPSAVAVDVDELIRMFADAAPQQNLERWAA